MTHLSPHDLQQIREALNTRRDALLAQMREALEQSGQTQYAEILGRGSGDSSDEALAVTLGDLSAARLDHEVRQLRALEAAAARIRGEEFGTCEDCGVAIPAARLVANPAATRCVACQELHEKTFAGQDRGSL
ncbi:MAG: TraR/DksA family transcriptional regulator [Thiobacillus sp.]|nr:TraR/DksA family transcriptional regulator [Thiobacillus sp.]